MQRGDRHHGIERTRFEWDLENIIEPPFDRQAGVT
jgi:hypothetical protein